MMLSKVRGLVFGVALSVLSVGPATAGGIPVIDVANLTQAIQQVMAWMQQYKQMEMQITQIKNQIDMMSGDRGMSMLLAGSRQYLPDEWNEAMNPSSGGSFSDLATAIDTIAAAQKILTTAEMGPMSADTKSFLEQARHLSAAQQAIGQRAYKTGADRVIQLQTLTNAIAGQRDPKAIMDLQARIQSEQAALTNDLAQLQAAAQLAQVQESAMNLMQREMLVRRTGDTFPAFPTTYP